MSLRRRGEEEEEEKGKEETTKKETRRRDGPGGGVSGVGDERTQEDLERVTSGGREHYCSRSCVTSGGRRTPGHPNHQLYVDGTPPPQKVLVFLPNSKRTRSRGLTCEWFTYGQSQSVTLPDPSMGQGPESANRTGPSIRGQPSKESGMS